MKLMIFLKISLKKLPMIDDNKGIINFIGGIRKS